MGQLCPRVSLPVCVLAVNFSDEGSKRSRGDEAVGCPLSFRPWRLQARISDLLGAFKGLTFYWLSVSETARKKSGVKVQK